MIETNRAGDLLGRLGVSAEILNRPLDQLSKAPLSMLRELRTAYAAGASVEANKFGRNVTDARVDFPPFGQNPEPKVAFQQLKASVGKTYYRPTIARHESAGSIYAQLLDPETQRSAKLARLLDKSPAVRSAFGKIAGAAVVRDGRMDGTVSLRTQEVGVSTSALTATTTRAAARPRGTIPNNIYEMLNAMDQAVLEQAQSLRPGQGSAVELGKGSLLGELISGGLKSREDDDDSDDDDENRDRSQGSLALGLEGGGKPVQGFDIAGPTESIDVGTLALKRLMDKRDQMYEIVRQTNDKFNQAAKTAIDAMRG